MRCLCHHHLLSTGSFVKIICHRFTWKKDSGFATQRD